MSTTITADGAGAAAGVKGADGSSRCPTADALSARSAALAAAFAWAAANLCLSAGSMFRRITEPGSSGGSGGGGTGGEADGVLPWSGQFLFLQVLSLQKTVL